MVVGPGAAELKVGAVGATVTLAVGVGVAVVVVVGVGLGLGGGVLAAHAGEEMVSPISVTAPVPEACSPASRRPSTVAALSTEMLAEARMVPRNVEPEPSVAELPTCQNTLHDWAPLTSTTALPDPVVKVVPAWNTNTAPDLPPPSSVSGTGPVNDSEEAEW